MSRNIVETLLGAVVLAVALGFLAWAYGRSDAGDPGGYTLRRQVRPGRRAGHRRRRADLGIKVGQLAQELDPATYRAQVTFSVRNGIELPADSSAAVVSSGLLGGKYLSLVPGGDEKLLADGEEITLTQSSVNLEDLIGRYIFSGQSGQGSEGGAEPARRGLFALGLALTLPAAAARADGPVRPHLVAMLQALDKITARTTTLRLPMGETVAYGTLRITARACLTTPPTELPESAVFLEIQVVDGDTDVKPAFTGWMFASSPSLSALEHPVYDVWLIECAEPLEADPAAPAPAGERRGGTVRQRIVTHREAGRLARARRRNRRR